MIGNYFNGVIEQVYHRIGQEEQNIVMACYGNSLTVSGLETVKRYSEESDFFRMYRTGAGSYCGGIRAISGYHL